MPQRPSLTTTHRTFQSVERETAGSTQRLVIILMFAPVDRFLRREATHLCGERRFGDPAAVIFHTVDEMLLADGKHNRQRVKESRAERIAAVPVRAQHMHIKMHIARRNVDVLRCTRHGGGCCHSFNSG